jgi:O-antigen ligase
MSYLSQSLPQRLRSIAWLAPPAFLLFILPFARTIALRQIAGVLTVAIAAWYWRRKPAIPALPLPCKAAIGFWVGILLLTLLWARDPAYSASELKADVGYSLLLFLALYALTESALELRVWLSALAAGSLLISLLAIVSFAQYGKWVPSYHNEIGEFATNAVTALPAILLLGLRNVPWSRRPRDVYVVLAIVLCAGTLTMSRMFFGALILMLLVVAALQVGRRGFNPRRGFLLSVVVACALAFAALIGIAEHREVSLVNDARRPLWDLAVQQILARPWTGTGYGRIVDQDVYGAFLHPHNVLLSFTEQTGIFGALGLVAVFAALGHAYWNLYRSNNRAVSYIGMAGLAMLTGVLAKNMTDMFFQRQCALLFWSLNGILLGYGLRAAAAKA